MSNQNVSNNLFSDLNSVQEESSEIQDESSKSFAELYSEYNKPFFDQIAKIQAEYKADCNLSLYSLGDVIQRVPAIKQKWVSRMCKYKNQLIDTKKLLKREITSISEDIQNNSKIKLTPMAIDKEATSSKYPRTSILSERCELLDRLVEDTSDIVNKHMRYFNEDIRAIIDFEKLERT